MNRLVVLQVTNLEKAYRRAAELPYCRNGSLHRGPMILSDTDVRRCAYTRFPTEGFVLVILAVALVVLLLLRFTLISPHRCFILFTYSCSTLSDLFPNVSIFVHVLVLLLPLYFTQSPSAIARSPSHLVDSS